MQNQRALLAVEGWLELGDIDAAIEELHNAPASLKSSPDILRLWIVIYARKQRWAEVETICEGLLKKVPDDHFAIMHQAEDHLAR